MNGADRAELEMLHFYKQVDDMRAVKQVVQTWTDWGPCQQLGVAI